MGKNIAIDAIDKASLDRPIENQSDRFPRAGAPDSKNSMHVMRNRKVGIIDIQTIKVERRELPMHDTDRSPHPASLAVYHVQ